MLTSRPSGPHGHSFGERVVRPVGGTALGYRGEGVNLNGIPYNMRELHLILKIIDSNFVRTSAQKNEPRRIFTPR